jgi:hypothetical protein
MAALDQAKLDAIRQHLTEEAQDEEGYQVPPRPSLLAALSDDEIWRLYRKIAFANLHPHSVMIEHEMRARLVRALNGFRESSEKASRRLEVGARCPDDRHSGLYGRALLPRVLRPHRDHTGTRFGDLYGLGDIRFAGVSLER